MVALDKDLKEVGKFGLPNACKDMHKAVFMTDHIFVLFCKNVTLWQYKNDALVLYHFERVQSGVLIHGNKISDDLFYFVTDSCVNIFSMAQKKIIYKTSQGTVPKSELVIDEERLALFSAQRELQILKINGKTGETHVTVSRTFPKATGGSNRNSAAINNGSLMVSNNTSSNCSTPSPPPTPSSISGMAAAPVSAAHSNEVANNAANADDQPALVEFEFPDRPHMKHWNMWDEDRIAILSSNSKLYFFNVKDLELVNVCDAEGLREFYFVRKYFIGFTSSDVILFDMSTCSKSSSSGSKGNMRISFNNINSMGKKFTIPEVPSSTAIMHYQIVLTDKKKRIAVVMPHYIGLLDIENGIMDSCYKITSLNNETMQTHIHRATYYGEKKFFIQQISVIQEESKGVQTQKQWLVLDMKEEKAKIIIQKDDAVMTGGIVRVESKSLHACQHV